jgi:hypothetical protein
MRTVTLALIAGALSFAQQMPAQEKPSQEKPSQEKQAPSRAAVSPAPPSGPSIPADAKEIEPNLFRYTDPQGKTWLYRRTPFGVGKWEDKPATEPAVESAAPAASTLVITDLGDSVQFVRQTPFGPQKSVRKKTELTAEEKAMLQREESKRPPAAAKPAESKAPLPGKTQEKQ